MHQVETDTPQAHTTAAQLAAKLGAGRYALAGLFGLSHERRASNPTLPKPTKSDMKKPSMLPASIRKAAAALSFALLAGMGLATGAQAQTLVENCATITSSSPVDGTPLNNTDCANLTLQPSADLSLTKTVNFPNAAVGSTVTFTLTLTNGGPSTATGVVVHDPEPTGFTFGLVTPDLLGVWDPVGDNWTIATLASGASTSLTIEAVVDPVGDYTNRAEVTVSVVPDPDSTPNNGVTTEDDYAEATVTPAGGPPPVNPPPSGGVLSITKSANPTLGDIDGDFMPEATFTVTISNTGTGSATYTATDTANLLPAGVTVSEVSSLAVATNGSNDPTLNLNPAFDGSSDTALLAGPQTIDANETHTFTIVVEYAIDTATVNYANLTCTGAPNFGFYNQAELTFTDKAVIATNVASSVDRTFLTGGLLFPSNPDLQAFSIPAGNERGLVIHAGFEREGNLALLLNFYTGGNVPEVTVTVTGPGGSIARPTTFSFARQVNTLLGIPTFGLAKELHTAVFDETDIATLMGGNTGGNVAITLSFPNTNLVLGDETYVVATAMNNVDAGGSGLQVAAQETGAWASVAGDYTIASGPFAVGTETTDAGDAVLVNGLSLAGLEQGSFGYLTPAGYTNIDGNANANSLSVFGLLEFDSEPSGMSTNTFFTNGAQSSVSIQSAMPNATPAYEGEMSVVTAQVASNVTSASACVSGNFIDLELEKTADTLTAVPGGTVNFTVTVTNAGGLDATGVAVTDLLPAGFTLLSSAVSQGSYATGNGVWTVGTLAPTASATLTLEAGVNAGQPITAYINLAEVTAANEVDVDSTPNNGVDTDNDGIVVDDPGDEDDGDGVQITVDGIVISKAVSPVALDAATYGKVRYEFTVSNNSGTETLSYDLVDTIDFGPGLPASVTGILVRQSDPGVVVATPTLDDGVATVLVASETLAPNATEVWELLVDLGTIPSTPTNRAALTACDPGNPTANTGLYNSADLAPGGSIPPGAGALGLNAQACPTGNNRGLLITKQASAVVSALPNGDLRAVYSVLVYNTGLATSYTLTDNFLFDANFTVTDMQILANTSGLVITPTFNGADPDGFTVGGAIGDADTHLFLVQVDVSHAGSTAAALADVGACDATSPEPLVGLTNAATLIGPGPSDVPITAMACPTGDGVGGTISFDKDVVSLVNVDADTVEVVYSLTVSNTTASNVTYDIADAFNFDPDFAVVPGSINVSTAPGGLLLTPGFDGIATSSPTIASGQVIAGGDTHTYTISLQVDYNGPNLADLDAEIAGCDPTDPQPGTGLFNLGVLTVNGIPVSDEACPGNVDLRFSKQASFVGYEGNDRFKVGYEIQVQNLSGASVVYDLADTPDFETGLVIASATLSLNGGPQSSVAALTSGTPSTLATGVTLIDGATDTYYLEVIIDASALATVQAQFSAFATCNPSSPLAGTGAYNSAVFTVDDQPYAPVEACPDGINLPVFATKLASAIANMGGGRLRVIYDVQVYNPGSSAITYDLVDALDLDGDFSIDAINVVDATVFPATAVVTANGFTHTSVSLASGATNTYRVEVLVQHASGLEATAITDAVACDPADPVPATGLYNGATVTGPNGVPITVEACPPALVLTKTGLSAVQSATDSVDVVYQITVENRSAQSQQYYLLDAFGFGTDFSATTSTTVSVTPGSVTLNGGFNGVTDVFVTAHDGASPPNPVLQTIAGNSTHTFTISTVVAYPAGGNAEADVALCNPSNPTPGTGLYNGAALFVNGIPTLEDACPNLSELALYKVANPTANLQQGDTVSYTFMIENNASSPVDTLTLNDPLVTNLSCAASSLGGTGFTWTYSGSQASSTSGALAIGDRVICTAVYTVTAGDVTTGSITNTAAATAVDGGGATLNAGASATVTTQASGAGGLISVTKSVTGFDDIVTANGRVEVGETVDYEIRVVNSGPTPLTNVQVNDSLIAGLSCSPIVGSGLASGATMVCTGSHTVTAGDFAVAAANFGDLVNTATATGQVPGGATVSDSDQAVISLDPAGITPAIDLSKYLIGFTDSDGDSGYSAGDVLVYGFTITNTGGDTLTNVTLTDSLLAGAPISCSTALPTTLAPLASITCSASYTVDATDITTQAGTGFEVLVNTATATGTSLNDPGLTVLDIEDLTLFIFPNLLDYGDLPDSYDGVADSSDDAAHRRDAGLFMGAVAPDEEAGKQAPLDGTGDDVTGVDDEDAINPAVPLSLASSSYSLDVTVTTPLVGACTDQNTFTLVGWIDFNSDGVFQANERSELFGLVANIAAGSATLSWPTLPGLTAPAGGAYAVRLRLYEGTIVNPQPIDFGGCGEVEDDYITSSDPDFGDAASSYEGGTPASHTPGGLYLGAVAPDGEAAPQPNGSLTGDDLAGVDDEDGINAATFLPYSVGSDLYSLEIITAQVPAQGGVVVGCMDFNDNGSFEAAEIDFTPVAGGQIATTLSWSGLNALPATTPASGSYTLRLRIFERQAVETVPGTIDPALVVCNGPGGVGEVEDHALLAVLPQVIIARKAADVTTVQVGDFIQWTLEFENTLAAPLNNVTLRDWLPAGVAYVAGSARLQRIGIDPAPLAAEPTIAGGSVLTWAPYDFQAAGSPGDTIQISILTTVGTVAVGATLENRDQALTAGGLPLSNIGRAFVTVEASGVFDCSDIIGTVFEDKNANGYQDQGEGGLAGVNIYTARGLKITVDRYGRYHVPCGATPDERGQNFILKLHEQTLPLGCQLTTENPRVVRLTPGKLTKANFGASCGKTVSVFLCDDVFVAGSTQVLDTWRPQVGQIVDMMKRAPVSLNITHATAGDLTLAQRRLARLSRYLRQASASGQFQSTVSTGVTNDVSRCPQKAPEPVPIEVCDVPTRYAIKSMISYCQGLRDLLVQEYYSYQPLGTTVENYNTYVRSVEAWKADYKDVIANQNRWSRQRIQDGYLRLTQRYHQLMTYRNTYVVPGGR